MATETKTQPAAEQEENPAKENLAEENLAEEKPAEEKPTEKKQDEKTRRAPKPPSADPRIRLGIEKKKAPPTDKLETITISGTHADIEHLKAVCKEYHESKPTADMATAQAAILSDMLRYTYGRWMKPKSAETNPSDK